MKKNSSFLFFLILTMLLLCALTACKSKHLLPADIHHTETIVKEKLVKVAQPADSAAIRALLECDENGKVLLRWLDEMNSRNTNLQFSLDSMGNLLANFRTNPDTFFLPGKDSIHIVKQKEVQFVEKKLNKWQRFCMSFTPCALIGFALFIYFKFKK